VKPFELKPGRSLGSHYEIVEHLGTGWEGEVYKVCELKTGIERAAKLFYRYNRYGSSPIRRYARKLHKLRNCPIVIQYHHHDTAGVRGKKIDFMVSDIADGEMLSRFVARFKGGRMQPYEALHLLHALASGVEQIHFTAEYHGDIHTDNIMIKRKGLGFEVRLIDFLDLGKSSREKIQNDVYQMISVYYEIIGGSKFYSKLNNGIKQIIRGNKSNLIREKFKTAGHLRLALENLDWERID
jgi:serine/threonine protein kinase